MSRPVVLAAILMVVAIAAPMVDPGQLLMGEAQAAYVPKDGIDLSAQGIPPIPAMPTFSATTVVKKMKKGKKNGR